MSELLNKQLGTSTAFNEPNNSISIDDIKAVMENLPPEPLAEYMKDKGFNPDDGCIMLIPVSIFKEMELDNCLPSYVRVSHIIGDITLINPKKLESPKLNPIAFNCGP